jgi:hypothetical protein
MAELGVLTYFIYCLFYFTNKLQLQKHKVCDSGLNVHLAH